MSEAAVATPSPSTDVRAELRSRQNLAAAVPAGLAAALVGAALWAAVAFFSAMSIGLVAVAVGALVGYAIRRAGKGVDPVFGVLGAACAALGWGIGATLSDVALLAQQVGRPFFTVLTDLGPLRSVQMAVDAFRPMDALFLAIAVYEGWKFSFAYRLKNVPVTS